MMMDVKDIAADAQEARPERASQVTGLAPWPAEIAAPFGKAP
jgi:hypothetical protein